MALFSLFLNILLLKLIISMKKAFNFLLIEKPKKLFYPYNIELNNNKLFGNIWFKKPKLISNDDLNQINLII